MKVIKSKKLSKEYEPRYICVDEETGKVLDDAQGYGFKSAQKAYACYAYKHKTDEQKREESRKNNIIKTFLNSDAGRSVRNSISDILFYGIKDELSDKEINTELFEYLNTIEFDFDKNKITKIYFLNYLKKN